MSVQPGQPSQVAKLTPLELVDLDNWTFIRSYNRHHNDLLDLAKAVYTSCCITLNHAPDEPQFHKAYTGSLVYSTLYHVKIAQSKRHLNPNLYAHYAGLLAKYVLEHDWIVISSVSCPP